MNKLALVNVGQIYPNPEQPRKDFDLAELESLAESIRSHGILVPVKLEAAGDAFILHDGERRLRAARMAGLTQIPAEIQPGLNGNGPQTRLLQAVIINIQRADMNPVEEGQSYRRMRDEFGQSGEPSELIEHYGMGVKNIVKAVKKAIKRNK